MKHVPFDVALYEEEQIAFSQFLEKGVRALSDIDLITVHGFLARCEHAFDKGRKFIDIIEKELLKRMSKKAKFGLK